MDNAYAHVLDNLKSEGIHIFGNVLDRTKSAALHEEAMHRKNIGPHMFLSEADYLANPKHKGVNPGRGCNNFLETFDEQCEFIEKDATLTPIIEKLLGSGYEIFLKKFVCGVPFSWIPAWLQKRLEHSPNNNLGAYVKPEYRDITYFHGIDFHQDCLDWPTENGVVKASDLLTLYVYIHDVNEYDAPLYALPKTHRFGATVFPHHLERVSDTQWKYTDDHGRSMVSDCVMLTGGAGYVGLWHSALLHGTQGIRQLKESDRLRLSLRYLLRRSEHEKQVGLDEVNASIDGPLSLSTVRKDLDASGRVTMEHNSISQIKS